MYQVSLSIAWILNFFPIIFNRTATHTVYTTIELWQELKKTTWSSASLQRLPRLSQSVVTTSWTASKCGNGTWKHWRSFAIAVREHGGTKADEDVDNRPIVGHLLMFFHWWYLCWQWRTTHEWVRGRLHCKGQYRVLSCLHCLHKVLITLKQATCEIYLLSI